MTDPNDKLIDDGHDGDGVDADMVNELQGRITKLETRAKAVGASNLEEYVDWLEEQVTEDKPSKDEPKDKPVDDKKPSGDDKSVVDDVRITEAGRAAAHAMLEAQWAGFALENNTKPEDERSSHNREELMSVIKGPKGALVQHLAENFGGNMWAAADYLTSIEGGIVAAKKEGANNAKALEDAKKLARTDTTIRTKTSDPGEPEDPAKALADEIAPVAGVYEGD